MRRDVSPAHDIDEDQLRRFVGSMLMRVVRIGHMRVPVGHRLMPVRVAVRSRRNPVMRVIVVSVVVRVRMFVLRRMVMVFVPMRLHQMQQHAAQHQNTSRSHAPAQRPVTQGDGKQGTDERGECKHRARASRAERPLCQQVQAQAQTVACGADRQQ